MVKLLPLLIVFFCTVAGAQNYGDHKQFAHIDFEDGTATDLLGNAITILQNGASIVTDDDGRNKVVQFHAETKGNLKFENSPINDSLTICFWFKREAANPSENWRMMFAFYAEDGSNIYFTPKTPWYEEASLIYDSKDFGFYLHMPGSPVPNYEWTHHAIVFTNHSISIYQNGEAINSYHVITRLSQINTTKWHFGNYPELNFPMTGKMDDIRIFHSALAANQIKAVYEDETIPAPDNMYAPGVPESSIDVSANTGEKHQTIRHFGASDGWNTQFVGLYFSEEYKEEIAELLFSKEKKPDGSPRGIGLSAWRFNIGAGTAEQGDASRISIPERRTEGFLNADGSYDWTKQAGQQWFLEKAASTYNLPDIVGWQNSPPIPYTVRELGFREYGDPMQTILKADRFDDFGDFLADVVLYFQDQGIAMNYISPLNEPQYGWAPSEPGGTVSQEGTPWTNQEISDVVKAIGNAFEAKNLDTKLIVTEAGAISHLLGGSGVAHNQLNELWKSESPLFIGNVPSLSDVVATHSYWNDGSATHLVNERIALTTRLSSLDLQPEFWQTEYCLLGSGYRFGHPEGELSPIRSAISLARVIHADLTSGNATGWSWWTSMEFETHLAREERFALIRVALNNSNTEGAYRPTTLLYALGHFSHFIRPGMKRLSVNRSDMMSDVNAITQFMVSAYLNEESQEVVFVAINPTDEEKGVRLNVNDPYSYNHVDEWIPYVTSGFEGDNLRKYPAFERESEYVLPPLSLATFVGKIAEETSSDDIANTHHMFSIHPNPARSRVFITRKEPDINDRVKVFDLYGNQVLEKTLNKHQSVSSIDIHQLSNGFYVVALESVRGTYTKKLVVSK